MDSTDPQHDLREAIAYLQKVTGHILTCHEFQKKQFLALTQKHDQQIQALTQAAHILNGSAGRLISDMARGVREQTRDSITTGLSEAFDRVHREADSLIAATRALLADLAGDRALQKKERRMAFTALLAGSALAVLGGGAWMGWAAHAASEARSEAAQAQMSARLIGAFNAADVLLCGGTLCVNVDRKDKQTINGKTYYVARPREKQP